MPKGRSITWSLLSRMIEDKDKLKSNCCYNTIDKSRLPSGFLGMQQSFDEET